MLFRNVWYWSVFGIVFPIVYITWGEVYEISIQPSFLDVLDIIERVIAAFFSLVNLLVVCQYGTYAVIIRARYKSLNVYLKHTLCEREQQDSGKSPQ